MSRRLYTARAELVLARPDHRPLREVELRPDPLEPIAAVCAALRAGQGERIDVVVDLLPVSGGAVSRRRRRLLRRGARRGQSLFGIPVPQAGGGGLSALDAVRAGVTGGQAGGWTGGWGAAVRAGVTGTRLPSSPGGTPRGLGGGRAGRQDLEWEVGKFRPEQTVFAVQVLVRAVGTHPSRARALLQQAMGAFDRWSGENWWRPVGPRRTRWAPYSSAWWLRRRFDRRLQRGYFAPTAPPWRRWVTGAEVLPWLKPPTMHTSSPNVARCGGVVPPAPPTLPTYRGQPDVVPLGMVTGGDGRVRLAGVRADDLLFAAMLGKSGYGKTELGLLQMVARAYAGEGCWFLDPHGAAVARVLPYLTDPAVAERVWEIRLGRPRPESRIATWNPMAMEGRPLEEIQSVVGAVVGAIASASGWGDAAPRARAILSNAVRTLAYVSWLMCQDGRADLQPTLFQLRTLLTDEDWREAVLAHLPGDVVSFWRRAFPAFPAEAVTTVTNILDRLDASLSLRAFLGSPRGGYDARRAMDEGRIVLLAPSGTGEADRLVASLLIFDLFRAGLSRQELLDAGTTPRTMWAWLDELTAIDGASHGYVAAILEQLRKYQVRLLAMTQMAMRLSESTRQALLTNQSLLVGTGADRDEADYLAKRMPGIDPAVLMNADRYEYVMSAVVRGRRTAPFRVRGVPIDQVYADYHRPEQVPHLQRQIDASLGRRPVREILAVQGELDEGILAHLTARRPAAHRARPATAPSSSVVTERKGT